MGHLARLVEPVVLLLLVRDGPACGYELAGALGGYALAETGVDRTALYRCLRQLEAHGHLESRWENPEAGPARRVYTVTLQGRRHLEVWLVVLNRLTGSLERLVREMAALPKAQMEAEEAWIR